MKYAAQTGIFDYYTSQSSIAHLTVEKLSQVTTPLPDSTEQAGIAHRFDAIDEFCRTENGALVKLRQTKSALMQDLLTGRVRVPVPESETVKAPADV